VGVPPINDTLYRILSKMPRKSSFVFGYGTGGDMGIWGSALLL